MTELTATIRPARPRDAAAIAKVHVETWRTAYAGLLPDDYLVALSEERQFAHWRHSVSARGWDGSVLVAEAPAPGGPEIVGFGSCGAQRASGLPCRGEVYTLYVASDWQGRGLGRGLLRVLFRSLQRSGISDALIWVLSDNPARYFYEAMGGTRAVERKERFAGQLLDETAYVWPDLKAWLGRQAD